jgi:undecaprenyl-diphosphatase
LAEGFSRVTRARKLSLRHALLLGIVQGPTEVLPVSSSAHIALHAGTAAALVLALRGELGQALRELDGSALVSAALALAPPALVGYLMEQRLERRPRRPRALAAGLAAGAAAMAWADTRPQARSLTDSTVRDGLALGLTQALALFPGVSRNGATLTAARARGFAREDAQALSWRVGLPVLAGAAGLKAFRLGRGQKRRDFGGASVSLIGPRLGRSRETLVCGSHPRFGQRSAPPGAAPALAVGAGAAFLSTLACAPLIRPGRRGRALWPFALYRAGLALVAVASSGSA